MKRRNFLNIIPAFSALSFLNIGRSSSENLSFDPKANLFVSTSGNLRSDRFYGLGFFQVDKPNKTRQDIQDIRKKYNYRSIIKYKSKDRFKIPVCEDIIELFVNDNDLKLFVKVIEEPKNLLFNQSPLQRIELLLNFYRELAEASNNDPSKVNFFVKSESPFGPSKKFRQKIESDDKIKFKLNPIDNLDDDLMQMASFLVGNVVGDNTGLAENPIKVNLLDKLKQDLGVSDFIPPKNISEKVVLI